MRRSPPPLRTYSHLAAAGQIPSDYEIVSSRLLYHVDRGFETNVPLTAWYQRHQRDGQLRCPDWEVFADPRQTTYAKYTALSANNEQHLNAVSSSIESSAHDARLSPEWSAVIGDVLPPMRYVWHGFQMIAAYVGQMAPAGRITLVALFQAADEMRRVHRIAHRLGQLRQSQLSFGVAAMEQWQELAAWQPLRRVLEEALVAYDWGEAFTALCLCIKPLIDDLLLGQFAGISRQRGDFFLGEILASFAEDARWHRTWAGALVTLLLDGPEDVAQGNRAALTTWLARWLPGAQAAVRATAGLLGPDGPAAAARSEQASLSWLKTLTLVPA